MRLTQPDAAVVDIKMPPTHSEEGLVAVQRIRAEHPAVGVLVLTPTSSPCTRCACWRRIRNASATCSRSASPTSPCWPTRCGGGVQFDSSRNRWVVRWYEWLTTGHSLIFVARQLGHRSITTTEQHYGHLELNLFRSALTATDDAITRAGSDSA